MNVFIACQRSMCTSLFKTGRYPATGLPPFQIQA
jgi:hypothetical protein